LPVGWEEIADGSGVGEGSEGDGREKISVGRSMGQQQSKFG